MLSIYLCLVLVTPAILALDLNPQMLNEFKSVFSGAIHQHLQAEYVLLMPIIAKQNETWKSCKESVVAQKSSCSSCVQSNCESPASDLIGEHLEKFETMLEAPGHRADWLEWHEMGTTLFGLVPDMQTGSGYSGTGMFPGNGQGMMGKRFFLGSFGIDYTALFNEGSTLSNFWNGFTSTLESVGSGIVNTVKNVGNTIAGWFGRRRRSVMSARRIALLRRRYFSRRMEGLNDESRECVEQCTECRPFFGDVNEVVSEVCGQQMVLDVTNMMATIHELKELYLANDHAGQGTPSILTKIEYKPENFRLASLSFGEVYVTAMTPSGSVRYLSEYRLRMQSPQTSTIEMAEELIGKWGL